MKSSSNQGRTFDKAGQHSIEVYDDNFQRNSILTRSARIRKFKFYQYKPILDNQQTTPTTTNSTSTSRAASGISPKTTSSQQTTTRTSFNSSFPTSQSDDQDEDDGDILLPRDEVVQGKIGRLAGVQQSKELSELDDEIVQLEKRIADLNSDNINNSSNSSSRNGNSSSNNNGKSNRNNRVNNLDEIFDLVNRKNDLIRRQMQLNILEQEKALEKANEELSKELRSLMSIDDSRKSKAQLDRQKHLYEQSVALVNKRNELVHHMDDQERGIEDDNALKATLKTVISKSSTGAAYNSNDQNCCIQ